MSSGSTGRREAIGHMKNGGVAATKTNHKPGFAIWRSVSLLVRACCMSEQGKKRFVKGKEEEEKYSCTFHKSPVLLPKLFLPYSVGTKPKINKASVKRRRRERDDSQYLMYPTTHSLILCERLSRFSWQRSRVRLLMLTLIASMQTLSTQQNTERQAGKDLGMNLCCEPHQIPPQLFLRSQPTPSQLSLGPTCRNS